MIRATTRTRPIRTEGESDKDYLVRLNAYVNRLEIDISDLERALMHADGFRSAVDRLYRNLEEKP